MTSARRTAVCASQGLPTGNQPWRLAFVALLILLCGGCQLMDVARFSYDNATSSHSWTTGKHETTVPFTIIDNHVILPVRVNGSEPMNFVLDSGAAATVIMDSHRTRSLALVSSGEISVSGVGEGDDPTAHIVRDLTLALGSVRLEGQSVVYLPIDSVPFFTGLDDVYFDGVIGAPFFNRFTVAIDYDRNLVTFTEPSSAAEVVDASGHWRAIPLQIEGGVPYLTAQVTNTRGVPIEVKLLADTGARGAVSLTPETHRELHLPTEYFEAVGQGLSGDVPSRVTMTDSLALGPYSLGALPADYALSGGESEGNSNGLLGNEALRRFNLVFDYRNERLLISPNQYFSEPLSADRSGLQIRPHRLGGIVRRIAPSSSAAQSSLQVGDIITSFNARPVTTQTVGDLKRALASDAPSVDLCWQSGSRSVCESLPLASRFRQQASG